ncbi:cytidine deaminase [Pokkaliibacter sp. CJK22405]|uniref:cytidine deaminase n=1 Tax=Pokkaliibacter sp. CJK22405 TaxID=3384615 RepID=UPI003984FF15
MVSAEMTVSEKRMLRDAARDASTHAYVPYSHFPVGAAIQLKDGHIVTGANIENSSYGLSNCAERSAIFAALSQGIKPEQFHSLMIYMPGERLYSPCGACRQVIAEFFSAEACVRASCDRDELQEWTVGGLLPAAFGEFEPRS